MSMMTKKAIFMIFSLRHDAAKRENDQITDGLAILIAVYRSILDEANSKTTGK